MLMCAFIIPLFTFAKTLTEREQRIEEIKNEISELKAEMKKLKSQKDTKEQNKKLKKTVNFDKLQTKYLSDKSEILEKVKEAKLNGKKSPSTMDQINLFNDFLNNSFEIENLTKQDLNSITTYLNTHNTFLSATDNLLFERKILQRLDNLTK